MYPRNAASPPRIAVGAVIQTSDGAVQSTGVSIVVRAEGGSETAGGGTTSYGASSSVVYYVPTQSETNYTAFVVTAYKTGCIPVSVTIITSATATAGTVDVGAIGGDTQSATDLKDFADAGYDPSTNKVQGVVLVDTTTALTNLPTIPTNWLTADGLATDAVNEIADGVWDEATAGHTTAGTYGGRIMRSTNSNVEVLITGSNHIAADVHEFQTAVIEAAAFAANSLTAAALAADAVTEIQSGLATSEEVAAEAVKTANILDGVAWILADATGAIAAPQSATATAILTTFGATYTVQYAGLTPTGVRTAPTLSKV